MSSLQPKPERAEGGSQRTVLSKEDSDTAEGFAF
jgi:hypothetical protein